MIHYQFIKIFFSFLFYIYCIAFKTIYNWIIHLKYNALILKNIALNYLYIIPCFNLFI